MPTRESASPFHKRTGLAPILSSTRRRSVPCARRRYTTGPSSDKPVGERARCDAPQGGVLTIETRNSMIDEGYASVHPGAKPGSYAMLGISDTGTGMTPELQTKVFEPFFTTKERGRVPLRCSFAADGYGPSTDGWAGAGGARHEQSAAHAGALYVRLHQSAGFST